VPTGGGVVRIWPRGDLCQRTRRSRISILCSAGRVWPWSSPLSRRQAESHGARAQRRQETVLGSPKRLHLAYRTPTVVGKVRDERTIWSSFLLQQQTIDDLPLRQASVSGLRRCVAPLALP